MDLETDRSRRRLPRNSGHAARSRCSRPFAECAFRWGVFRRAGGSGSRPIGRSGRPRDVKRRSRFKGVMRSLALLFAACTVLFGPTGAQQPERWRISPEPLLRLGGWGASAVQEFFRIRAGRVLEDGSIVVAQQGELLLFAADGALIRYLGREGNGPGEFKSPVSVEVVGDISEIPRAIPTPRVPNLSLVPRLFGSACA